VKGACLRIVPPETLQRLHPLLVSCADPYGALHWLVRTFRKTAASSVCGPDFVFPFSI